MNFFSGITYNLKGLRLGLKTPRLLMLGLIRLAVLVVITVFFAGLFLFYHQQILDVIWSRPESAWVLWLWHLLSWLLSLFLVGLSSVFSYFVSQILFSVIIMDTMSQMTERMVSGGEKIPAPSSILKQFIYLIRQEIPRAILPVFLLLALTILGWLTPAGPLLAVFSSGLSVIFLAWDHTDLIPARRREPFKMRFLYLMKNLPFHLGFGLWFLVPGLNILFLSFAPVGATLYYIRKQQDG